MRSHQPRISGALAFALTFAMAWLVDSSGPRAAEIYDFNGTCQQDCAAVGLNTGDAVSASISFGFVDLNIGTFNLLDTNNPVADGFTITASFAGGSITNLTVVSGANLFLLPAPTIAGKDWELSLSAGGLPAGSGAFTRQATPTNGSFIYDFNGTCDVDCAEVGASDGDAVSGQISFGFVDLDIGSFNLLDSDDPLADGLTISAVISGGTIADLDILGTADAFLTPGPTTGDDWELSLSAGGLPSGNGEWAPRAQNGGGNDQLAVPEPGTLALFAIGLIGLAMTSRRRRFA